MQPARAFAPNATTFLTHLVVGGLADTRYVVERFKSMLDGDIRPVEAEAPKGSRRRKAKRVLTTLKEVKEMRPGRNEIIVCTGLNFSRQPRRRRRSHRNPRSASTYIHVCSFPIGGRRRNLDMSCRSYRLLYRCPLEQATPSGTV